MELVWLLVGTALGAVATWTVLRLGGPAHAAPAMADAVARAVAPLHDALGRFDDHVRALEASRARAHGALSQQVHDLGVAATWWCWSTTRPWWRSGRSSG